MTNSQCEICGKPSDACSGHEDDWKSQLDNIPTPGAGKAAAPVAEAPKSPKLAGPSLKDELDSIPDPGAPKAAPPGEDLKSLLDAIPDPGSGASGVRPAPEAEAPRKDDTPEWMKNYDKAKSSINTSAAPSAVSNDASIRSALDSIPSPGAGGPLPGAAPAEGDGEVPQWQKNFQAHQSAVAGASGPLPNPDAYVPRGDAPPAVGGGSYQMIAILLVVICIAVVGFLMTKGAAPLDTSKLDTTTSSPPPSQ